MWRWRLHARLLRHCYALPLVTCHLSLILWHPSAKPLRFRTRFRARSKAGSGAWVTTREAFWIALEALRAHKLRSFLTLLGVVIATTTLIVVMSIINGMNLYIADHIANLGANVFVVHQYQWAQGYEAWLKARRRNKPIRIEEFEFLQDNLQGLQEHRRRSRHVE